MHFCADELMALMASIPFLGLLGKRIHAWWHKRTCPHLVSTGVGHNPDPVRYVSQSDSEAIARSNPSEEVKVPGWYFMSETWADMYGPYETEQGARLALRRYCETL